MGFIYQRVLPRKYHIKRCIWMLAVCVVTAGIMRYLVGWNMDMVQNTVERAIVTSCRNCTHITEPTPKYSSANRVTVRLDSNKTFRSEIPFGQETNTPKTESVIQNSERLIEPEWVTIESGPMGIYMLSAFWDDRWINSTKPVVSILTSLETYENKSLPQAKLFCHWIENKLENAPKARSAQISHTAAMWYTWRVGNAWYRAHVVPCEILAHSQPTRITMSYSPDFYGQYLNETNSMLVEYPQHDLKHTFGVCVPLSFGRIQPQRIVEWMELQKILAVSWVGVHNYNLAPESEKVMRYYAKEGFVHLRRNKALHMEKNRDEIRSRNAITEDDCIYRHMYSTKYILVLDLDEVIVPTTSYTLDDMVDMLERRFSKELPFYQANFVNYFFLTDNLLVNHSMNVSRFMDIPFLQYRFRIGENHEWQTKSIISPRGCAHMDNHKCHEAIHHYKRGAPKHSHIRRVPDDIGRLLHYRSHACYKKKNAIECMSHVSPSKIYADDTMLKYETVLKTNVNSTLIKLNAFT